MYHFSLMIDNALFGTIPSDFKSQVRDY